jgi:hypothetical protein
MVPGKPGQKKKKKKKPPKTSISKKNKAGHGGTC